MHRELLELFLGALAVGDVDDLGERVHRVARGVPDEGEMDDRMDRFAVGTQVATLELDVILRGAEERLGRGLTPQRDV